MKLELNFPHSEIEHGIFHCLAYKLCISPNRFMTISLLKSLLITDLFKANEYIF